MLGTADWLRGAERRALAGRLDRKRPLGRAPALQAKQRAHQPVVSATDLQGRASDDQVKARDWLTAPDAGRRRLNTLRFHGGLFGPPVRGGAKRSGPQATRSALDQGRHHEKKTQRCTDLCGAVQSAATAQPCLSGFVAAGRGRGVGAGSSFAGAAPEGPGRRRRKAQAAEQPSCAVRAGDCRARRPPTGPGAPESDASSTAEARPAQAAKRLRVGVAERRRGGGLGGRFHIGWNPLALSARPPTRQGARPTAQREDRPAFFWRAGPQRARHRV